jgi:hypothetical protein
MTYAETTELEVQSNSTSATTISAYLATSRSSHKHSAQGDERAADL